jgi:hypothetical protein
MLGLVGCVGAADDEAGPLPPPPAWCTAGVASGLAGVTYPTVQAGLDASAPGDTVYVCPGYWEEDLTVPHAGPLTVTGLNDGWNLATLTPASSGRRVLELAVEPASLQLDSLYLSHGEASQGGTLAMFHPDSALVMRRMHVTFASADDGGCLWFQGATLSVEGVRFDMCQASGLGGAAYVAPERPDATVRMVGVVMEAGVAAGAPGFVLDTPAGTGFAGASPLTLRDVHVVDSQRTTTSAASGALMRLRGDRRVRWVGGEVSRNASDAGGGGLVIEGLGVPARVELVDVAINANQATGPSGLELRGAPPVVGSYELDLLRGGVIRNRSHLWAGSFGVLGVGDGWRVRLRGVDLGEGLTENMPQDVDGCATSFGAGVSGIVWPAAGDFCP